MKTRHKIYFVLLLIAYVAICFYAFSRADTPTLGCHVVQSRSIVTAVEEPTPASNRIIWDTNFRKLLDGNTKEIELPSNHIGTVDGWEFLRQKGKPTKADLAKGFTLQGNGGKLYAEQGNIDLWRLRSTKKLVAENYILHGNNHPNTIGIHVDTAEGNGGNGAHQIVVANLFVKDCETGLQLGGTYKGKGPDHRHITFINCEFVGGETSVRATGGNICAVTFLSCRFAGYSRCGYEAVNRGGHPQLTFYNCLFKSPSVTPVYACSAYQSTVVMRDCRIEGPQNGVYTSIVGNARKFGSNGVRRPCVFDNVQSESKTVGIKATAGMPISLKDVDIEGPCEFGKVEVKRQGFCATGQEGRGGN